MKKLILKLTLIVAIAAQFGVCHSAMAAADNPVNYFVEGGIMDQSQHFEQLPGFSEVVQ